MRHSTILFILLIVCLGFLFLFAAEYESWLRPSVGLPMYVFAPILSGLATVAVLLVNLFLILVTYIWPDRPRLKVDVARLEVGQDELDTVNTTAVGRRSRIRLKVTNDGEVTANDCVAEIDFPEEGWRPGKSMIPGEPIRPSLLHWNRVYFSETVVYGPSLPEYQDYAATRATVPIEIRPRQSELLDIAFAPAYDDQVHASFRRARAQVYTAKWMYERRQCDQLDPGSYEAIVSIFSSNAKHVTKKIRLSYAGQESLTAEIVYC